MKIPRSMISRRFKIAYACMKSVLGAVLLSLIGGTINPATAQADHQRVRGKIKMLYPHSMGKIFVQMDHNLSTLNCTPMESRYLTLNSSQGLFNQIYATILAAHVSQRTITIRIYEGSPECQILYVMLE